MAAPAMAKNRRLDSGFTTLTLLDDMSQHSQRLRRIADDSVGPALQALHCAAQHR
jgi:hypothetical protein